MKGLRFFMCSMFVAAGFSFAAEAQENGNRDSLNRIVRGPYETNGAGDNWFIGIGGGINLFEDGWFGATDHKTRIAPALNLYFGKWFTPSVGARIGYSGLRANGWLSNGTVYASEFVDAKNMYKEKINFAYIHGDLMWNISNAFSGYKETRFWNVIPYVSAGLLHGYGAAGVKAANNQFAFGAGIYNTLRISDRVNLTLDARQLLFKGTFNAHAGGMAGMSSISVGVAVNLGKTNWKRAGSSAVSSAVPAATADEIAKYAKQAEELAKENEALAKENDDLKQNVKALEDALEAAPSKKITVTPNVVFFAINSAELDSKELFRLDYFVKNVMSLDESAKFVLKGYADNETGGYERNQYLREKRVEHILNLLRTKYGISEDRLLVKVQDTAMFVVGEPELNRCVVIERAE